MDAVADHPVLRRTSRLTPILLVATLAACEAAVEEAARVDEETRARVVAVAGPAATRLAGTLSGELMAAVREGGAAGAIGFCSEEAMELTDGVAEELGVGWEVKRTARRTRNPANAPDALESDALDRFHVAEAEGAAMADLVQRVPDGSYRYYRPLRIVPLCMECHGSPEAMQPAVLEALEARYPGDRATGYKEGELRGLIRITVPASAIEEG